MDLVSELAVDLKSKFLQLLAGGSKAGSSLGHSNERIISLHTIVYALSNVGILLSAQEGDDLWVAALAACLDLNEGKKMVEGTITLSRFIQYLGLENIIYVDLADYSNTDKQLSAKKLLELRIDTPNSQFLKSQAGSSSQQKASRSNDSTSHTTSLNNDSQNLGRSERSPVDNNNDIQNLGRSARSPVDNIRSTEYSPSQNLGRSARSPVDNIRSTEYSPQFFDNRQGNLI
jgi:hypothetical protein